MVKIVEHLNMIDDSTPKRNKRELLVCQAMLTDSELEDMSSIKTAYRIARTRIIEDIIKKEDPVYYDKIMASKYKIPIFNIEDLIKDFL